MTEINFYKLSSTPINRALPKLVESVISKGNRIKAYSPDFDEVMRFDEMLWTFSDIPFIPHGTKNDAFPEDQKVYLTDNLDENPNNANVLLCLSGITDTINNSTNSTDDGNNVKYTKVLYMFEDKVDHYQQNVLPAVKKFQSNGVKCHLISQASNSSWKTTSFPQAI